MEGVGDAEQGFEGVAQSPTGQPFDKGFAGGVEAGGEDLVNLSDGENGAVADLDKELARLASFDVDVFDADFEAGILGAVSLPQLFVGV